MDVDELYRRAAECFSARDFEGADRILGEALKSDSGNVQTLANLASVRLLKNDLTSAGELFQRALCVSPQSVRAAFGLTKVRLAQHDDEAALAALQSVNQHVTEAQRPEFFKLIGVVFVARRDWDVATTFFRKYAAAAPDMPDPFICICQACAGKGDSDALLAAIEELAVRFPALEGVRPALLAHLEKLEDFGRVGASLDRLLAAAPDDLALFEAAAALALKFRQYAYAYRYYARTRARAPHFDRLAFPALARMEQFA